MGEVYLAHDSRLDRRVALKVLPADLNHDAERLRRFVQEAKAASALNHPNIVTIYEIGESEAGRFIAMELIEGKTLRSLSSGAALSFELLTELTLQIARALKVAHEVGIVHRDIKPDNIMVRDDGYVKILDFGLARLIRGGAASADAPTLIIGGSDITSPGIILGTLRYMSPEQTRGEPLRFQTDIFSLGVVLYELITGLYPFASDSAVGVMHAIMTQPVITPTRLNPTIPATIEALILRMLEKNPALRPTAGEIEATLNRSTDQRVPAKILLSTTSRKRNTVGHVKERIELKKSFAAVENGAGTMLCLAGEPGIGKSTIVEDFLSELTSDVDACFIARGRCSERLAGSEAYLPFLEALENLLRTPGHESIAEMMKMLAPTWYAQIAPFSNDSSAIRAQTDLKTASQEWMKRELTTFLVELSLRKPLVLFLDDLHWSDTSTVELLSYLADRIEKSRVLLLNTYRLSELQLTRHSFQQIKLDLQARGLCHELILGFLTREDIHDYLELEFPVNSFPAELPALIYEKTEGSPLFMADLTHYLRDRKVIAQREDRWVLAQTVPEIEQELPESVRSMIQRKVDQLSDEQRTLLMAASVQGNKFHSAVLGAVVDMTADEIEECLETLDRFHGLVQLVDEIEFPDLTLTLRYQFVHVLYQNVLYASVRPTRKASLSASIASELLRHYNEQETEIASEVAFLLKVGRDFYGAAKYFLLAGHNAARVYANQEAILFYQAAAEMIETDLRRPNQDAVAAHDVATQIFESLGKIFSITGRHKEASTTFGKALTHIGEQPLKQARVHRQIATTCVIQRRMGEALKALDIAETHLQSRQDERSAEWWNEYLKLQLERAWVFYWRADLEELVDVTTRTQPLIERYGTKDQQARFFYMLMLYHLRREHYAPTAQTVEYADTALALIENTEDVAQETTIRFGTGFVYLWLRDFKVAEENILVSLQLARRTGDSLNQVLCLTYLTVLHRQLGDVAKASNYNTQARKCATAAQMSSYESMARANSGWLAWRRGDLVLAKEEALAAWNSWEVNEDNYPMQWATLWVLIAIAMNEEMLHSAVEYARQLFRPDQQLVPPELSTVIQEGLANFEMGDTTEAQQRFRQALDLASQLRYL